MATLNGKVLFYDPKYQTGTIGDEAGSMKRYVFHDSDVVSGETLEKDQLVFFTEEVSLRGGTPGYRATLVQGRPYRVGMTILSGTVLSYSSERSGGVIADKNTKNLNHYTFSDSDVVSGGPLHVGQSVTFIGEMIRVNEAQFQYGAKIIQGE